MAGKCKEGILNVLILLVCLLSNTDILSLKKITFQRGQTILTNGTTSGARHCREAGTTKVSGENPVLTTGRATGKTTR